MDHKYTDRFFIRVPIVSKNYLWLFFQVQTDGEVVEFIINHFSNPSNELALYIASPSLHERFLQFKNGQITKPKDTENLLLSLSKYLIRSSTRSTPFGLFAGVSTGNIGQKNSIELNPSKTILKNELKIKLISSLSEQLIKNPSIKSKLAIVKNSSVYRVGPQLRYVQKYLKESKTLYRVVSIQSTPHLEFILNATGTAIPLKELEKQIHLFDAKLAKKEILSYIDNCIKNQILTTNLESNLVPGENIEELVSLLKSIPTKTTLRINNYDISAGNLIDILQISESKLTSSNFSVSRYREIEDKFAFISNELSQNVLHSDSIVSFNICEIDKKIPENVLKGVKLILNLSNSDSQLFNFKRSFLQKYGAFAEIPLLLALDGDAGIGYPTKREIHIGQSATNEASTRSIRQFLLKKLLHATKHNLRIITLKENELDDLILDDRGGLSNSFSCVVSLLKGERDINVLISAIRNPGGAKILGRFCKLDRTIESLAKEIINSQEYSENDNSIIAEINHFSNVEWGNLLTRPKFHKYEIPYLGRSTLNNETQILPEDLLISVENERLVLRSKSLNKIIIPQLNNAHNYKYLSTPVYEFLCDLENQGSTVNAVIDWTWFESSTNFIPRVIYENIILNEAYWIFETKEFDSWRYLNDLSLGDEVKKWRIRHEIPRYISIANGDNFIVIDLENAYCLKLMLQVLKNQKSIRIFEYLTDFDRDDAIVKDEEGKNYGNEIVFFYQKPRSSNSTQIQESINDSRKLSSYPIGSEWLYLKVYAGFAVQEIILAECLQSLQKELKTTKMISNSFFVRYDDSDPHLRLRYQLIEKSSLHILLNMFNEAVKQYVSDDIIWKLHIDSYKPDSYGPFDIRLVEKLFSIDTDFYFSLLQFEKNEFLKVDRKFIAYKCIDMFLNNFNLSFDEKLTFTGNIAKNFLDEFGNTTILRKKTTELFRNESEKLNILLNTDINEIHKLIDVKIIKLLNNKSKKEKNIILQILGQKKLKYSNFEKINLMSNCVHLFMNKLNSSDIRRNEMEVYNVLWLHYRKQSAIIS
ncbi:thiopeptide-type bacteriocin biosynthesis protein [Mucilaginibacter gracilis]|uniref:Thiopeptide-type bacteriocin biosynthesis protein n=1 Tax=Mucilaginibacter gracilis TaxID=423350 RepID=A0A495J9V2_9SPHI|nr:lantibiotic dehydratase [Mucilaginibacter gracilis]RKR85152.1 thiopeptide-type bacteriocin biosynthesis protein [Mucilaginibacter gracilis]